jgi:hypothetical protein
LVASHSGGERRRAARRDAAALVLLTLIVAGCAVGSAGRQAPQVRAEDAPEVAAQVRSRDYKLPLRPERAADPGAAAAQLWSIAKPAAERLGAKVASVKKSPKPSRDEVVVLDTADHTFRRHGLVLRRRGRASVPGGSATHEMTLASRMPDIRAARAAPVEPAGGMASSLDFKEEILVDPARPGGSKPVWSLESCVRQANGARDLTLADVSELFPQTTGRLGAATTPVSPVGGLRIEQVEIELPTLTFGATAVRPALLVWRDRDGGAVIAAEYGFTEKLADYWNEPHADANAIRAYYAALQSAAADWIAPTATKVGAVYDRATARASRTSP